MNHSSPRATRTIFVYFIVSVFVLHVPTKTVTSHLFTPLFMFIHLPLIHIAPRLLIDFKNSKRFTYFCILLCIIMHLLLCVSPDWLIFCHMIISHVNSLNLLFVCSFCFSLANGQCLKRWTLLSLSAVHQPFHISICISALLTQPFCYS